MVLDGRWKKVEEKIDPMKCNSTFASLFLALILLSLHFSSQCPELIKNLYPPNVKIGILSSVQDVGIDKDGEDVRVMISADDLSTDGETREKICEVVGDACLVSLFA